MNGKAALLVVISLLFTPLAARAEEQPADPTAVQRQLTYIKYAVAALDENVEAGIITKAQADQGKARYLDQASKIAGHQVTLEELKDLPDATAASPAKLSALQRFAGLITFVNILWVLAIGVGVLCFVYLFGKVIITLIQGVPVEFYEVLLYLCALGAGIGGKFLSAGVAPYVGLTGCLLLLGAMMFTVKTRHLDPKGVQISLVLTVVWAAAALWYQSPMLGFIACAGLLSTLGFSVIVSPLCYCIGFEDEKAVGNATSAAFLLLAFGVLSHVFGLKHAEFLQVFDFGSLFLGSFVGYLGLLIASSRWYDGRNRNYVLFQVATIAAGVAALAIGSIFGISVLQKVGGTFFCLYLVEKLWEIPVESKTGYALIGLVSSAMIFAGCYIVKLHPETFRPFLPF